jgi:hypothetical protein
LYRENTWYKLLAMRTPNQFFKRELPSLAAAAVLALGVAAVTRGDGSRNFGTPELPTSPVPDGFYHRVNAFASEHKTRSIVENGVATYFYEDKDGIRVSKEYCEDDGTLTHVYSNGDIATDARGINLGLGQRDICEDEIIDERDAWGVTMDLTETATIIDPLIDTYKYETMEEVFYYEDVLGYKFDY